MSDTTKTRRGAMSDATDHYSDHPDGGFYTDEYARCVECGEPYPCRVAREAEKPTEYRKRQP